MLDNTGYAKFTHHDIQSEMMGIIADMLRRKISANPGGWTFCHNAGCK
jgi:hypothetical protein